MTQPLITSKNNPLIKHARSLKSRKSRNKTGQFLIEGIHQVGMAVEADFPLSAVIYSPEYLNSSFAKALIGKLMDSSIDLVEVSGDSFNSFASREHPQGLAAIGNQAYSNLQEMHQNPGIWIALEEIQDPGNLGSIMRTMDACGAGGVILIGNTVDAYHPTCVRSSTGAIFTTKIIKSELNDFQNVVDLNNIPVVGTVCDSGNIFYESNYKDHMILAMGSEQKGLSQEFIDLCDDLVTIPMTGRVDSLNLAIATSLVLFDIFTKKNKTHD